MRLRAAVITEIRSYFHDQGVTEVSTPLLARYGATDPTIKNIEVTGDTGSPRMFLQTSPESAMKRLLVAGCGEIYQICAAFRGDEAGRWHLPEFQILEWYRLGFDHHRLMKDVESLVGRIVPGLVFERCSYADLFRRHVGVNPHTATLDELAARVSALPIVLDARDWADRAMLVDILFGQVALPALVDPGALFIYDFPVEHAAYARIRDGDPPVAERFELIVDGIELANGYHELTDPAQQRSRYARENALRARRGLPEIPLDEQLVAGLAAGLPACAGVALGIDRLVMLRAGVGDIREVVSFGDVPGG